MVLLFARPAERNFSTHDTASFRRNWLSIGLPKPTSFPLRIHIRAIGVTEKVIFYWYDRKGPFMSYPLIQGDAKMQTTSGDGRTDCSRWSSFTLSFVSLSFVCIRKVMNQYLSCSAKLEACGQTQRTGTHSLSHLTTAAMHLEVVTLHHSLMNRMLHNGRVFESTMSVHDE